MPKLKVVPAQAQKELLTKCEDLSAELHDLVRFQEGNYVEDVGPRLYGEYVRAFTMTARAALDAARHYQIKQFMVEQERELAETLRKRAAGQEPDTDRTPAPATTGHDNGRRERVRL